MFQFSLKNTALCFALSTIKRKCLQRFFIGKTFDINLFLFFSKLIRKYCCDIKISDSCGWYIGIFLVEINRLKHILSLWLILINNLLCHWILHLRLQKRELSETGDKFRVLWFSLAIAFSAEKFCWRIEIIGGATYSNVSKKWNQTFLEFSQLLANDEQQPCRILGENQKVTNLILSPIN